ncbi:MAG: enoyl-CoA hydratase family protein [Deltaproteobacteria bacterium]
MTPSAKGFLYEEREGVATLTLNRPEQLNALTFEVYEELRELFPALERRPEVRAVVITGAGRGFCSGGDVRDIIGRLFERDMPGLLAFTRLTCDVIAGIRALRKPVVAALNATGAGAGAAIALASDIRIAAPAAKIGFLFVRVGLAGADMGAAFLLPRVVGLGKATELLMTGDVIAADEALRIGLYNRVVPQERLLEEARGLALRLARGPSFALGVTKELLNEGLGSDLSTSLGAEARAQAICMQTKDFREAYEAFVAKREPRFSGS